MCVCVCDITALSSITKTESAPNLQPADENNPTVHSIKPAGQL